MARRESQGLQIALILFVMITVVLSVSTWFFWSENNKNTQVAEDNKSDLDTLNKSVRSVYLPEIGRLKEMIGWPVNAEMADVEEQFAKDMPYLADLPVNQRNYRALPGQFLPAVVTHQGRYLESVTQARQFEQDVQNARSEEQQVAAAAREEASEAAQDLRSEVAKFSDDRETFTTQGETISVRLTDSQRETAAIVQASQHEIQDLSERLVRAEQLVIALQVEIRGIVGAGGTFENPDGDITWVNQGSGVVWLSLGSADGLRRQVSFGVYDVDENNLVQSESKGTIEITRIMGEHLSEARITSDSLSDPILPGDLVYSAIWQPGQHLRFALAGFMDIDDDGESDRDMIRRIITMNGGVIDAEVDDEGVRTGVMSIHTRYLVLGERPTERTDQETLRTYIRMISEAQQLGIETLSIEKMLALVGYHPEDRSIPLGRDADSDDFRARSDEGPPGRSTGNTFRPRRPPERGDNGAY